jgi:hypothetical protein
MNRERRLAERRLEKQARKEARKRASEGHADPAPHTPTDEEEQAGAVDAPL